jgi:uncharacterized delta-60 repeat protein
MIRARLSTVLASVVLGLLACAFLVPALASAAPGDLDPSFGTGGIALTDFGPGLDKAVAMAIQPDGKYVLAGTHSFSGSGTQELFWTLARFNAGGSLDATFGTGGKVVGDPSQTVADVICLPADSSFIVASVPQRTLSRYLAGGTRDMAFGASGIVQLGPGSGLGVHLAARAGGGFVVGDTVPSAYGDNDLRVRCFRADGSLDTGFGSTGNTYIDIAYGSNDQLLSLAVAPDNSILIGGQTQMTDSLLVKLTPAGSLDQAFGTGGIVVTSGALGMGYSNAQISLRPDGSIVTADGGGSQLGTTFQAVRRYSANGALDTTFGSGGIARLGSTDVLGGGYISTVMPRQIQVQPDGSIILAGAKNGGYPRYNDVWLARLTPDGKLDTGFGTDGQVVTDLGGADDCAATGIGPDGKLVVAGYAYPSGAASGASGLRAGRATTIFGMGLIRYDCGPSAVKPILGPKTFALKAVSVRHGRIATFFYRVTAATAKVTVKIRIYRGTHLKKTLSVAGSVTSSASHIYKWKCSLPKGKYTWKVYATDTQKRPQISMGWKLLTVK